MITILAPHHHQILQRCIRLASPTPETIVQMSHSELSSTTVLCSHLRERLREHRLSACDQNEELLICAIIQRIKQGISPQIFVEALIATSSHTSQAADYLAEIAATPGTHWTQRHAAIKAAIAIDAHIDTSEITSWLTTDWTGISDAEAISRCSIIVNDDLRRRLGIKERQVIPLLHRHIYRREPTSAATFCDIHHTLIEYLGFEYYDYAPKALRAAALHRLKGITPADEVRLADIELQALLILINEADGESLSC